MFIPLAKFRCITERYIDLRNASTLKNLCLTSIHLLVNEKKTLKDNSLMNVDFSNAEKIIDSLELPPCLKSELKYLSQNCLMHFKVSAKVPKLVCCIRYVIDKESELYEQLKTHPKWNLVIENTLFTMYEFRDMLANFGFASVVNRTNETVKTFIQRNTKIKLVYHHY